MARAQVGDIQIAYEIEGSGPPLLLVMGLGGQLTDWHPGLIDQLTQHFTVIRFDNRDIGLSTYSQEPAPSRWELIKGNLWPASVTPAYTLDDMADDAAGLLGALGIDRVHVVGMSMGGMIAQLLTLRHPEKVESLCSIMSNTGDRRAGRPTPRVVWSLATRGQPERNQALDVTLDMYRLVGGPDWDEAEQRCRSGLSLERSYNPAGMLRQSQAIATTPDRTKRLGAIAQPTLVMHGLADTLVRSSGGIATTKAIPTSRLVLFPGMGHDLPATRHGEMVLAIRDNASRVHSWPARLGRHSRACLTS